MKTIYEFKKGDEIVRIIPAKPLIDIMGKNDICGNSQWADIYKKN